MIRCDKFMAVATEMARVARSIILQHYRTPFAVETKSDATPVTIADRAAEAAMRKIINAEFPHHGIMGEEYGNERIDAEFVWVLDPIDGTKSFMSGKPLFGSLIALCQFGKPIMGIIDMPALDEQWSGAIDRAAVCNGHAVQVRTGIDLSGATLYATTPYMFEGKDAAVFERLAAAVKYPLFGADCYGYATVAGGWSDLVVEAKLQPYDYLACAAVVKAAGGVAMDWQGRELSIDSGDKVLVAGSLPLATQALSVMATC